MSRLMIEKRYDKKRHQIIYSAILKGEYVLRDDSFVPEEFVADSLIGNVLKEINSCNGDYHIYRVYVDGNAVS